MAQHTEVVLVDDLDGGHADETVTFALDGAAYEIDLSAKHAGELRAALNEYTSKARRAGRTTRSRTTRRAPRDRSAAARNTTIRSWARLQGLNVSHRGRISAEIIEKWEAAGRPGT
jgi:nucleoid-associated protein Lsr2